MNKPKQVSRGPDLRQLLRERIAACRTVEELNDRVISPFVQEVEAACRERGYIINIYGEQSNLAFTGDEQSAEEIYALIEDYLDARQAAGDDA